MSLKLDSNPKSRKSGEAAASSAILRLEESAGFAVVLCGILILSGLAYLSMAYNWPKFSRAEVFFAECVREMFQADNLVTPLYHGTPFFDKPILAYWFIAASYKIFGISHFAARIPSVIAALSTVALSALGAKRIFGGKAAALSAAVLSSSLMFMSFANLCMSDMCLVFFDTLSLTLLYAFLHQEKKSSVVLYLAALSLGLAFIIKGPVGIVLPAVSFAAFLSITKQWRKIDFFKDVLPCLLILAGAGIPWFMAACRQNGAGALSYFFIHENLQRFAGSTYDTHKPFWFMLFSLFSGMLPWSVFLPFALAESWRSSRGASAGSKDSLQFDQDSSLRNSFDSARGGPCPPGGAWRTHTGANDSMQLVNAGADAVSLSSPKADQLQASSSKPVSAVSENQKELQLYLWIWIATAIGFFSLSRGKIDYYALPAYPAAAILIGNYLSNACEVKNRVATISGWLLSIAMLSAGIVAAIALPGLLACQGINSFPAIPIILLVSGLLMVCFSYRGHFRKTFKLLFVSICLLATALSFQIYPWISSKQAVLKYVPYIKNLDQDSRIGVYTSLQNWIDEITFQTDKEPLKIESIKMAERFMQAEAQSVLLIQENEFNLMSSESRRRCTVLASSPFIPRSLNPVYFIGKREKLGDNTKLLLILNSVKASE